ncbi:TM0106 family RecB-like putative nuclease [Amycolatopsis balhimycina DSM 5908]|uniref:TM0106 family RecB-like putative nuclease n=1 Tax=Amycolatopsis balhimycina DSM 5908 TaxID=1081091 RepID=A0A428WNL0_AMYBA|nr:bifunctional RecB family nuclease/DEAD/DEAH box helicase [Amycolatopsis balhimycina]RSM44685.1 TM0106 family RecB-like putative nuclease [Amycolatopsis balhimycina DSM 5908]
MLTPADLADLLECEHRSILVQALAAGLPGAPRPGEPDAPSGRAVAEAILARFRAEGREVAEIDVRDSALAAKATEEAARSGAAVIHRAVLRDDEFSGQVDFLVRDDEGRYEVYDAKPVRHATPAAVVQLTACADVLRRAGWPAGPHLHLGLSDGGTRTLRVEDFRPLVDRLRARLRGRAPRLPVPLWADERPACAGCGFGRHCASAREADRDLSLVAGMRGDQRRKLAAAGLGSIDALAAAGPGDRPRDLSVTSFAALRAQAALQVRQDTTGEIAYEIVDPGALATLPSPAPGDVFAEVAGDPHALAGEGLEYLFGAVGDGRFTPFWAHSRAQERRAFEDFVDFAAARVAEHPGSHVYHYAPYEVTAIKRLAAVHGTREETVDHLLRSGAVVDLHAVVRKALRVSQRSYSIRHLEPLYQPGARGKTAVSDVEAYEEYLALAQSGEPERADEALRRIGENTEDDCVSARRLFEFLHRVRDDAGIAVPEPAVESAEDALLRAAEEDVAAERRAERAAQLAALVDPLLDGLPDDPGRFTADERARALLAASVGYHRRETNPAWWEYFRRLAAPLGDLEVDTACAVPVSLEAGEWVPPAGRARTAKRTLMLACDPDRPHPFAPGDDVRLRYGDTARDAKVVTASAVELTLEESCPPDATTNDRPTAVLPGSPVRPSPKDEAVAELARLVVGTLPALPRHPGVDLLRRTPPRLRGGRALPEPGEDLVATVIEAVDALDGSALAVQGPPGAGKTYLAGKLIAHLVRAGRTVAVTSTSHKAVENVLSAAKKSAPELPCAKRAKKTPDPAAPWDQPKSNPALVKWREEHDTGHLVGGTAWTFANAAIREEPFDLMIIDEAGQFALADALAVSVCARNVLLLGDPQQLPQVVQGTHPAGAEASALGHLIGDADIMPPSLGYFLDETRRMHPAVCEPVSNLSYAGRLHAHPSAAVRVLEGVTAGLYLAEADHQGNTTRSVEEAAAVVRIVSEVHGRMWTDHGPARPLGDADILVVAPYNLQARTVTRALADAGFPGVRVGTVDRFQGQEAPVVIATMTSSSAVDLPRGLDFLLSRNRLNVALSRAQALAVLVCSPRLVEADIRTVDQMRLVAGMIGLMAAARPWPAG